jgi:beta-glucosidase
MKPTQFGLSAAGMLALSTACSSAFAAETGAAQPEIGTRSKPVLQADGLNFKDSNGNGSLDAYEDWRLPAAERAQALTAQMSLEEKAGLMLIDTMNAACDEATGTLGVPPQEQAENYIFNQKMHRFIFRNTVAGKEDSACDNTPGFRSKNVITPGEAANYINAIQEMSESTPHGIPVLFKSNARNHIAPDARAGINNQAGAFSSFPKEAGIAAAALGEEALKDGKAVEGDMSVVEQFAAVMGEEWRSIGLRGMYGYMADLSTEPRWYRTHETFTEDADLAANIMGTLVATLQGSREGSGSALNPESPVALTLKHFPGGGPQELGLDPHYSYGKTQVYSGGGFGYNLKPFVAAIDAGVASIMPYYGIPVDASYKGETFEEVGFAFSDQIVNGLLRDTLSFAGYVNSDTGIINSRAWGLESASVPERVAAAVNGGTDTLSGFHEVSTITDLASQGLVSEARIDQAAERLLTPMFQMGLFENPYADSTAADATVGKAANQDVAMELQRKSLVLLQNGDEGGTGKALPLEKGATLYLLGDIGADEAEARGFTVVDGNTVKPGDRPSAAGADVAVINVSAGTRRKVTMAYKSTDVANHPVNPISLVSAGGEAFMPGLTGASNFGATDQCVAFGAEKCTDIHYFGGSLPWEAGILDFTGMSQADSWQITPPLAAIQQVIEEIGDPGKVVLSIYFRQPYVLDEDSGLRDAGAILANFGVSDAALFDVLSGEFNPQGRMPFALPATVKAVQEQFSDRPGYAETADGALFEYGHGLRY